MRLVARLLVPVYLVPAALFFVLVATAPASPSGYAYAGAALLLALAGAVRSWGNCARAAGRLKLAAVALFGFTVATRLAGAGAGQDLRMGARPGESARWVDRLLDEQDLAVNAARALKWTGFIRDPDVPSLAGVMGRDYDALRREQGATPSPVVATYLGLEEPGTDDTIVLGDVDKSAGVVVFLHGFAGSFTLPCWVVSRAAHDAGFATVCPSTRWVGDWWSTAGEATLRETVRRLRGRGVSRIVLAGLSNGGVGASVLAPRFPAGTFDGMMLISGASDTASSPGIPVLVVQGERDSQINARIVHAYADRVGGRYLSLDAGHFAMLGEEPRVRVALTSFLRARAQARETAGRLP